MQNSSNVVPNRSGHGAVRSSPARPGVGARVLLLLFLLLLFLVLVAVVLIDAGRRPGTATRWTAETNVAAGALFAMLLLSEVWVLASRTKYSGQEIEHATGLALSLCLPGAFGGAMAMAAGGFGPSIVGQVWPLLVAGVALALAGLALRLWAIVTLGPMFQQRLVIQDDHAIVTAGPYRLLRHPSYTGPILIFVGIGLVLNDWAGLFLCIVLPVSAYVWRISVEERMLVAGLGPAYERYRERTWRLFPGIW